MEENDFLKNLIRLIKKYFSSTLLVAILTGAAYISAYLYQAGYLGYYGIPDVFIEINAKTIIFAAMSTLSVPIILVFILYYFLSIKPKNKFLDIIKFGGSLITLVALGELPAILGLYSSHNLIISIFLPIDAVLILLVIKLNRRNKLMASKDGQIEKSNLFSRIERVCGALPLLFGFVLIYFIFCSDGMGAVIAKTKTNYLVAQTNPPLFVVSTYSGNFVCLTYNLETNKFNRDIIMLTPVDISSGKIIFAEMHNVSSKFGK